jgi:hypothetical protein
LDRHLGTTESSVPVVEERTNTIHARDFLVARYRDAAGDHGLT